MTAKVFVDGVEYSPRVRMFLIPECVTLGEMLKFLRLQYFYTLDNAAAEIGCSKSYLWGLEKDRAEPSLRMAKAIASAYAVPVEKLAACLNSSDQEQKT